MNARRLPLGLSVAAVRAILPIARTWRFRGPDDPYRPLRTDLESAIHATWHEHLLPLSWLFAHRGVATLASQDRDGEIISRILTTLGYVVARGSSTRGGSQGFRGLARAARAGRPIVITCDGPRGPRRVMKEGTARLSGVTERPVVPVGLAAVRGWRLAGWDRFLIPAPGSLIFVSFGTPRVVAPGESPALEVDLAREVEGCEVVAREAGWALPPRIRRRSTEGRPRSGDSADRPTPGRYLERRIRAAWTGSRPAPGLRLAAVGFGAATRVRGALFDTGGFATFDGGLPVVSVGGVTVGGSGKTPITSYVAGLLSDRGHTVAILTRGYEDELLLHKRWRPEMPVWGHPDRVRIARRAAARGASVAILDDGFQHRRLRRDADIVLLDRDALRRTTGALLPAGPFREPWRAAVRRADIVLLSGREPWSPELASFDADLREELGALCPEATIGSVSLDTGNVAPVNAAARDWSMDPAPHLALTGIMKPNLFFHLAVTRCPSVSAHLALADHGMPPADEWPAILARAGDGGFLMTYKDVSRMSFLVPESVPLWALAERLSWRVAEADVGARLAELVGAPGSRAAANARLVPGPANRGGASGTSVS